MKPNRDQTNEEFIYTFACKKMLHELASVSIYLDEAKTHAPQGLSAGAITNVEARVRDLRDSIYNALKTV